MLRGLPASILIHGAVVFGGAVAWPYIAPEREVEDIVPVTLDIELDVTTNLAAIIRPEPKPEPEIPEPEEDPAEEIVEDPKPDAEDVETGEDELETTDVREIEPESKVEEVVDPLESEDATIVPEDEKETDQREPDSFDDILGDASKLFSEEKKTARRDTIKRDKKILVDETKVEEPRKGVGDRSRETARIEALIYSQMIECWEGVLDQPNYERLQVTVKFRLKEDGSLDGDVELVNPRRVPVGDRPMRLATERALRAARKCTPYRIPKDALVSFDEWKDVVLDIGH